MNHFSIDCEALAVSRNNAAILSIGMVAFDPTTGKTGAEQYYEIDIDDAIRHGHIDGSTLCWWLGQSPHARNLFSNNGKKVKLAEALDLVAVSIRNAGVPKVWLNGPLEDGAWLKSAFTAVGMDVPWHHTATRDMRTIVDQAQLHGNEVRPVGVSHNALDDAIFQARVISYAHQKIAAAIGGKKFEPKIVEPADVEVATCKVHYCTNPATATGLCAECEAEEL